jgi:hypothetical protein
MNMIKIVCPKCSAEAKLSLVDTSYVGPRRCWKCHEFFTITIENNRVTSCEPLSQEEYERQQEAKKAAEKAGGHISFSRKEQPAAPAKTAVGIDFVKPYQPNLFDKAAETSRGGIDFVKRDEPAIPQRPPEKRQDIIRPVSPKEPPRQAKPEGPAIFPPERYQTFVPLEDVKEPEKPQKTKKTPEKQRDYSKPLTRKEPSSQTDSEKPAIFPQERYQTFVPLEDTDDKPGKP